MVALETQILTAALSQSSKEDGTSGRISARANRFIGKLELDVKRTWISKESGTKFIAESLLGEVGELLGALTKEQRKNSDNKTQIAFELVDSLYFFVKFINAKGLEIKNDVLDHITLKIERRNFGMDLECLSPKAISEEIITLVKEINDNEAGKGVNVDERANLFLIFMGLLKIAEKRKIDIAEAWAEKAEKVSLRK